MKHEEHGPVGAAASSKARKQKSNDRPPCDAATDLECLGFADHGLLEGQRQKARHDRLDVVEEPVDHIVAMDLHPFLLGHCLRPGEKQRVM